jgi:superfamily II DNA or RNA helicase
MSKTPTAAGGPTPFAVGSLVRARGRSWVVLPSPEPDLLMVRPLGGVSEEETGILLPLEVPPVEHDQFPPPGAESLGDHASARLLREAVRLGFRSSAGPFRSLARVAVEPRSYQIVPLLMALRLEPVRLLVADDVGVGKTIEACLIARELIDRGEADRFAVLCPPHLAEQWQRELRDKFHLDAELVLSSTVTRLERTCGVNQSLFQLYPRTVVSIDLVKSQRFREGFLHHCPELVLIDEAHNCTVGSAPGRGGGRHLRYDLARRLSEERNRHLILVTATPHSGDASAFRNLLGLLDPEFRELPEDLSGDHNRRNRQRIARQFVQRRRADIRSQFAHLGRLPFPERKEDEATYKLSADYRRLFRRVLEYARERVDEAELAALGESARKHRLRVRWWSVLALLRAMASSPAAAAATLRSRAPAADTETDEEADEVGRQTVLDLDDSEAAERMDATPGGDPGSDPRPEGRLRRRLLGMALEAEALQGDRDAKLTEAVKLVGGLLADGFRPILFCRFVDTAEYVAAELRQRLPAELRRRKRADLKEVTVEAVTGRLPPEVREERVEALMAAPQRVLVCTDCLSEGINLQQGFDAVLHYDLAWNPVRHEQREGRADRFGQPSPTVRVLTYFGADNQIDGIVLRVLLRRHRAIRRDLEVSVPVLDNAESIIEAVTERLLRRGRFDDPQRTLFDEAPGPEEEEMERRWRDASAREKRSRTLFAQESIQAEEVHGEIAAAWESLGTSQDVAWFCRNALRALGGSVQERLRGGVTIDLAGLPAGLPELIGGDLGARPFHAAFDLPVPDDAVYLGRTHPLVDKLAGHVLGTALDERPATKPVASRANVIVTGQAQRRTTLLVVRFRFHLVTHRAGHSKQILAEDCGLLSFRGAPATPEWLSEDEARGLLACQPEGNVNPDAARDRIRQVLEAYPATLHPQIEEAARQRADVLRDAHRRVREAAQLKGVRYEVAPSGTPDLLSVTVYLPK